MTMEKEPLFRVGDIVKVIQSADKRMFGLTFSIRRICKTQCEIVDINDNSYWVEYNNIEVVRKTFDPKRFFGLSEELKDARKECEKKILEAICEFHQRTGLRVTSVNYDCFDTLDGNMRSQSVSIDARVI